MTGRPTIGYQPALDGVRAVAVLAVLLFHGEVPWMSGGYLGVSVFFTLSGFLITSLLVNETDATGRVAIGAFYARRARRLLPASIVCIGLIVAIAAVTDVFAGVTELRRQAIGSLLQVANWVFLFGEGSYQELFQQSTGAVSPLEHYWSLAIEEQFYWLWPVAFLGFATAVRSRRARVAVMAAATVLAGLCAPFVATVWGGDAAYWATPARASEILVGALLAVVLSGRAVAPRWAVLAPVAAGCLIVGFVTFPAAGGPAYAGALPLVGVVSAALLLGLQAPGPARRALSAAPLVWLGTVSYGVYLYHWPIYVIVDERRTGLDGVSLLAVRLAITLVVAQASYTWLEQPIRHGRRPRWADRAADRPAGRPVDRPAAGPPALSRPGVGRRTFAAAAGSTAVAVAATVVLVPAADSDYWSVSAADAEAAAIRPSDAPLAPLIGDETADAPSATDPPTSSVLALSDPSMSSVPTASDPSMSSDQSAGDSPASVPSTILPPPTDAASTTTTTPTTTTTIPEIPPLSRPVRIVVAGDSTAEASGVGLVGWAAAEPELAQVELDAAPGCGFVRGGSVLVEQWRPVPDRCDTWLDVSLPANVATLQPDVVMLKTTSWDVLDHRWTAGEQLGPADPAFRERIDRDFAAVTGRLLDEGAGTVAWVMQPVPNPLWLGWGQTQEDPERHQVLYSVMQDLAGERPGQVAVIDLTTWLSDLGHDTDVDMRPDGVHWSPEASRRIADEFLGDQLIRVALGLARP